MSQYNSLEELHKSHPWRTARKFVPLALKYGFKERDARRFIEKEVLHDIKTPNNKEMFLPIYSQKPHSYQFDTLIQSKGSNLPSFLIFININTRKAYAYPMNTKGTNSVIDALNKFKNDVGTINILTSDQDKAYLSEQVHKFLIDNNIDYHTTHKNNHHILGIINRFIRTIRDLNNERDFTIENMTKIINDYNSSIHSSTGKSPNDMDNDNEKEYIEKMNGRTFDIKDSNSFDLPENTRVHIINETKVIGKKRLNISKEHYLVAGKDGNNLIIKAKDHSTALYPRHRLIVNNKGIFAKTIDEDRFGIIDSITGYNEKKDQYEIVYEGGVKDKIKSNNLREQNPTKLSATEISFWKNKNIPTTITSRVLGFKKKI